jgi:tetratricopeptide (TPR) repeat protein
MPTLEQKLEERKRSHFTNRENEVALFRRLLEQQTLEFNILAIHGIGGVGKTSLLEEFRRICAEKEVPAASIDGQEERAVLNVLLSISNQLSATVPTIFEGFSKALARYLKLLAKLQGDAVDLRDSVARGLISVVKESVPFGIGAGVIDAVSERRVSELFQRGLSAQEIDFLMEADETLTGELVKSINVLSSETRVVIIFDTYEKMEHLDSWVREALVSKLGDNVLIIISGREELTGGWTDWQPLIKSLQLLSFPADLAKHYLNKRGILESALIREILSLTQGHPLGLALSADLIEHDQELTATDFANTPKRFVVVDLLVKRILRQISDPTTRDALRACAVLRYFNVDTLRFVLGSNGKLYEELQDYSFVYQRSEGLALHSEVRAFLTKDLMRVSPAKYDELNRRAVEFYEMKLKEATGDAWKKLSLEKLYHLVNISERAGIKFFVELFYGASERFDVAFCEALLGEIETQEIHNLESRAWIGYCRAMLKFGQAKWTEAQQIYRQLLESPGTSAELKMRVCIDLGTVLRQLNCLDEAIPFSRQGLELAEEMQNSAETCRALCSLGYAYARLGNLQESIAYYKKSIELAKQMGYNYIQANALNEIGNPLTLSGRYEEAIAYHTQALQIARELQNSYLEAMSEYYLGTAYRYKGFLVRSFKDVAIKHLTAGLELFRQYGDRHQVAKCLSNLGTVYWYSNMPGDAIRVLKEALEIFHEVGDTFEEAVMWEKLGLAYCDLERWRKAIECFNNALPIARSGKNRYFEYEVLSSLCKAYYGAGKHPKLRELAHEIIVVAEASHWFTILVYVTRVTVDWYFTSCQYEDFFREMANLLAYSLKVNPGTFRNSLDRFVGYAETLIANNERPVVMRLCEHLKTFWSGDELKAGEIDVLQLFDGVYQFTRQPTSQSLRDYLMTQGLLP